MRTMVGKRNLKRKLADEVRLGNLKLGCGRVKSVPLDGVGHESWRAVFRVAKSESEESGRGRFVG